MSAYKALLPFFDNGTESDFCRCGCKDSFPAKPVLFRLFDEVYAEQAV
jgi:hypothetical protein